VRTKTVKFSAGKTSKIMFFLNLLLWYPDVSMSLKHHAASLSISTHQKAKCLHPQADEDDDGFFCHC